MNRRLVFAFTFLLLLPLLGLAQDDVDSLRNLLKVNKGEELVNTYNSLAKRLFTVDPRETSILANNAFDLSVDLDYDNGKIDALKIIGSELSFRAKYDTALTILNEASQLAESVQNLEELAKIGISKGNVYLRLYRYEEALNVFIPALEYASQTNLILSRVALLTNISVVRTQLGELEVAKKLLLEALDLAMESSLDIRTGQIYGNLGILEYDRGNYRLAVQYFQDGLTTFRKLASSRMISTTQLQLGRVYVELKDFDKALIYLDSSLTIAQGLGLKRSEVSILRHKAKAMFEMNSFDETEIILDSLIPKAIELKDDAILMDLYALKYKNSELKNDFSLALEYYKKWAIIKDSLAAKANRQEANVLSTKFDYDRLQAKVENEQRINQLKFVQRNRTLITLLILLIASVIIFSLNRLRLKQRLAIAQQREELMEKEIELNVIQLSQQANQISAYQSQLNDQAGIESINKELVKILQIVPLRPDDWARFNMYFEKVFPGFLFDTNIKVLSANDTKLLRLMKLGLSSKEMSEILGISPKSVSRAKLRLAGKLKKSSATDLEFFVQNLTH